MLQVSVGQTSRVDAVNQAIAKAKHFGFDLNEAVLASDAFFPFRDGADVGIRQGASAILQAGGSARDFETIEACNEANPQVAMKYTGQRSFKH